MLDAPPPSEYASSAVLPGPEAASSLLVPTPPALPSGGAGSFSRNRTPARKAFMLAEWPEERLTSAEILRRINEIDPDARPLPSVVTLRQWARQLGVVRPYAMIRNGQMASASVRQAAQRERVREAFAAGMSLRQIAVTMRIGRERVRAILALPDNSLPEVVRVRDLPPQRWRTPERIAYLQTAWPAGEERRFIIAAMNAMPGPPLPIKISLAKWANEIGLTRPASMRRVMHEYLAAWKTEERAAVMRREFVAGTQTPMIRNMLAALPGDPLPTSDARLLKWALRLGLKRPAHYRANARPGNRSRAVSVAKPRPGGTVIQRAPVVDEPPTERPPEWPGEQIGDKLGWTFGQIRQWAAWRGVVYDGTNVDRINKMRAAAGMRLLVQVEG